MWGRLRTSLSVLSAFLVVLTLALWVRAYSVDDELDLYHHEGGETWHRGAEYRLYTSAGRLGVSWYHSHLTDPDSVAAMRKRVPAAQNSFQYSHAPRVGQTPVRDQLIFSTVTRSASGMFWQRFVWIPLWAPAALFALGTTPLVWRIVRRRRDAARARARIGHCAICGYDLRGGHDRCPECGSKAPTTGSMLASVAG